jgi:hypothetical protein
MPSSHSIPSLIKISAHVPSLRVFGACSCGPRLHRGIVPPPTWHRVTKTCIRSIICEANKSSPVSYCGTLQHQICSTKSRQTTGFCVPMGELAAPRSRHAVDRGILTWFAGRLIDRSHPCDVRISQSSSHVRSKSGRRHLVDLTDSDPRNTYGSAAHLARQNGSHRSRNGAQRTQQNSHPQKRCLVHEMETGLLSSTSSGAVCHESEAHLDGNQWVLIDKGRPLGSPTGIAEEVLSLLTGSISHPIGSELSC